jgi:hypothetical protein
VFKFPNGSGLECRWAAHPATAVSMRSSKLIVSNYSRKLLFFAAVRQAVFGNLYAASIAIRRWEVLFTSLICQRLLGPSTPTATLINFLRIHSALATLKLNSHMRCFLSSLKFY